MHAVETVTSQGHTFFSRVIVGIDGSEESREAARQAAILVDGELTLVASYDIAAAIAGTGIGVPVYLDVDSQRTAAEDALGRARESAAAASPAILVVRGRAADELISAAEREQSTLVVVGSHEYNRLAGFVLGSTATEVIHKAPCSVLVARRGGTREEFPTNIVVGVDGSRESATAYAEARQLSERFSAELWPVVAHGGEAVDRRNVEAIVDRWREDSPDRPVGALVAAAADADLLVVGSRGLHGLKALGSVAERVAHRAGCSVLIVREPTWERRSEGLAEAA
jgi:nucleotide-binding universal stress UspA family protein